MYRQIQSRFACSQRNNQISRVRPIQARIAAKSEASAERYIN